ncbi:innexin inx2-like isoform X1 [Scylla paramamosain]|uniref:innexin inx2-like isoform X1 n=2 Tax=Scylla paramamosain TaxID=85552 RepID=UPI00308387AC
MPVGLLSSLSGFLKLTGKTDIDSPVSKLHHNFTTLILLCFCLLLSASSLIGDPIQCTFNDHPLMKEDMIKTYCWLHTTFTLPRHYKGAGQIYPGIGATTSNGEFVYHAYYQWVPFVLFLQAIMFYAPYWLWKMWEGGVVDSASTDLAAPVMNKEELKGKIEMLGDYLQASLGQHNKYAMKYLGYEALNLVVTISNICVMDAFLGGKFISYGTKVFSFAQMEDEDRIDPMIMLFPRMTKCTFRAVGPSGTTEKLDSLCILPHNILNEKAYLFLWVWLWILLVAGSFSVLWRCIVFFVPFMRINLLRNYTHGLNNNETKALSTYLSVGDYFLFYLLHKNVSRLAFTDLVRDVAGRISSRDSESLEMGDKVRKDSKKYHRMNSPRPTPSGGLWT